MFTALVNAGFRLRPRRPISPTPWLSTCQVIPKANLRQALPVTSNGSGDFWLKQRINRPVVCGHSMGGAIAQLFALTYPDELSGLILLGSGARLRVHPTYLQECEDGIREPDRWLNGRRGDYRLVETGLGAELMERAGKIGPAVKLNDLRCCDAFDVMDRVGDIRLPTLVLCGSCDVMTPVKYSQYLHDRIEGSEIRIVLGGSHFVQLEQSVAVNAAIEEFMEKHSIA